MARASPCVRWSTMATVCGFARSEGAAPAGNRALSPFDKTLLHAIQNDNTLMV